MARCLTRRTFLKTTGACVAALPWFAQTTAFAGRPYGDPSKTKYTVPTVCGMCRSRCPLLVTVDQGRFSVQGNAAVPAYGGKVCARAHAAVRLLSDPDRLKYPMQRVGPRGAGRWQRISWSQAIDSIADKIADSRRGTMALCRGGDSSRYISELFQALPQTVTVSARRDSCLRNREFVPLAHGDRRQMLATADCLVFLGSHLGENVDLPLLRAITAARQRGAKLIVVDPRMSVLAAKADYHLMVRPGTDTALLLGWLNILAGQAPGSTAEQAGQETLRQRCSSYPIDRVARLTDLDEETIRETALLLHRLAPKIYIHPGQFSSWYGNDVERLRAMELLQVLLSGGPTMAGAALPAEPSGGAGRSTYLSGYELWSSAEQGAISVLGCWGQNPLRSFAHQYITLQALAKIPFIFACDILPTETTLHADIILPEASFLERADILHRWDDDHGGQLIGSRFPVVEPVWEARDPYWIVQQLSSRLGVGDGFLAADVYQRLNHDLMPLGMTLAQLFDRQGVAPVAASSGGTTGPAPPSMGRAEPGPQPPVLGEPTPPAAAEPEDVPGSEAFVDQVFAGRPPAEEPATQCHFAAAARMEMPVFTPAPLPPPGYIRLLSGRVPVHSGGFSQNNDWLNREIGVNRLWLNDRLARLMGLVDGEKVFLENQDGLRSLFAVQLLVTCGIRTDCVFLAHGFGSRSRLLRAAFGRGGADEILLSRTRKDPVSASHGLRVNFVRIVKGGRPLAIPRLDQPPAELPMAHVLSEIVREGGDG